MSNAKNLSKSTNGYIIAPAGYGKTHLIAETVIEHGGDKELILTHTHAGLAAIKKQLSLSPDSKNYKVETIDGFILRYVTHYPEISGWDKDSENINWINVRESGVILFKKAFIKNILQISFSGVYIDEYQDCLVEQHAIILEFMSVLPVRILGDPLQGIFGFGSNKIIDWQRDVEKKFVKIAELDTPWRWINTDNSDLAKWVAKCREELLTNKLINLTAVPRCVSWIKKSPQTQVAACFKMLQHSGASIIAIGLPVPAQFSHDLASKLKGTYTVVEPLALKDIFKYTALLESKNIFASSAALLNFLCTCFSGISKSFLTQEFKSLAKQSIPHRNKPIAISKPLEDYIRYEQAGGMLKILQSARSLPNVKLFRKELFFTMIQVLTEKERAGLSFKDAFVRIRENKRRLGRGLIKRAIGSTLLVKGLEFDHAIILDADALDVNNLYVALSRATKSLTILSETQTLKPKQSSTQGQIATLESS